MKVFSDYIPSDLLLSPHTQRFVKVLDELCLAKELGFTIDDVHYKGTLVINDSVNPVRIFNLEFLKKFLYAYGQLESETGMPKRLLENLILNAYNIFAKKGTKEGLELFVYSACLGDILIDDSELYVQDWFISLGHIPLNGYLPIGLDLANVDPNGNNTQFNFLFSGEMSDYYNALTIKIISPYVYLSGVRTFISEVLPDFLPFIGEGTDLNIHFYSHSLIHQNIYNPLISS